MEDGELLRLVTAEGADAAVVRAAIMGGLFVLAFYLGRQTEVRTSLIFTAIVTMLCGASASNSALPPRPVLSG